MLSYLIIYLNNNLFNKDINVLFGMSYLANIYLVSHMQYLYLPETCLQIKLNSIKNSSISKQKKS